MKQYKVVKVRPKDKKKDGMNTYDVLTLEDNDGKQYEVDLGFYQYGEVFWFFIADYDKFNTFLKKQTFRDDYDITDAYNIQEVIHKYEEKVIYKDN